MAYFLGPNVDFIALKFPNRSEKIGKVSAKALKGRKVYICIWRYLCESCAYFTFPLCRQRPHIHTYIRGVSVRRGQLKIPTNKLIQMTSGAHANIHPRASTHRYKVDLNGTAHCWMMYEAFGHVFGSQNPRMCAPPFYHFLPLSPLSPTNFPAFSPL